MKKITKLGLLMILAMTVLLTACGSSETSSGGEGDESKESKALKVVTNAAYAPMEFLEGDKVTGFDIELVEAVAEEAGYEVDVVHTGWEAMLVEVESAIADLAIAAITINDDRKAIYDFTVPYFKSSNMILVKEDSDIQTADDLKDKIVAVQNGTTGHESAQAILGEKSPNIKTFEDNNLAVQELLNNGADAVIADKPVVENYVANNPDQGLKVVGDSNTFDSEYYGILFPKGSELQGDFDEAVKALLDNGKYAEIYKKWFGVEPDIEDLKAQQ